MLCDGLQSLEVTAQEACAKRPESHPHPHIMEYEAYGTVLLVKEEVICMFVSSEKSHLPLEGWRVGECGIGFRKSDRGDVDSTILDRNVAGVVWQIRMGPKGVVDSTRKVLRYFRFAAVLFVLPPVFFLACSAQGMKMISSQDLNPR